MAALSTGAARAEEVVGETVCGALKNAYGPFDYRTDKHKLWIVEAYHFNKDVESLRAGQSTSRIGGDISYTLRAFPNHIRALQSVAKLGLREKTSKPKNARYSVDCWFDRAMRFRPDDREVRVTYGVYLYQAGKREDALKILLSAEKLGEDGGNFHYNIALLYADLGNYDLALRHAHRAYAVGYNLPGLRAKLQAAGRWQEPTQASN